MAGKTLVAVFSASGVTKKVGEEIARIAGADFFEIVPKEIYTEDDLNWMNKQSRSSVEMNDPSARPEINGSVSDMASYDKVIIGYPIWWGEEPRIMDTFVESYSFDGKTMIPFFTSSSSGMGRSGQNLADKAGSGTWLDGQRFGGGASREDIRSWIEGLK